MDSTSNHFEHSQQGRAVKGLLQHSRSLDQEQTLQNIYRGMKKTPKTNTVTDEQGRVRFHGAFTGGFSAGYYNTVGSSEGFQPAQFVSSRSNRAAQASNRSIADYMDEGDGLLGGKLSAQAGIDSFSVNAAGPQLQVATTDSSSVSSGLVGEQLISNMSMLQKSSDTVGKKLLATMGWRLGQGIGPRVTKKRVNYFDTKVNVIEMHPGADLSKLPKSSLLSKGVVTFAPDDEAQRVEYPPIKNDFYGIGFDVRNSGRLDAVTHSGARSADYIDGSDEEDANVYRMGSVLKGGKTAAKDSNKRTMAPQYGQATQKAKRLKYTSGFAYDDAEDDVYSNDAPLLLGNGPTGSAAGQSKVVPYKYSHEVQEVSVYGDTASSEYLAQTDQKTAAFAEKSKDTLQNIHNSVDNWLTGGRGATGVTPGEQETFTPGSLSSAVATARCPSDNRLPLPGFHVARTPRVVPPYYPPPEVPSSFQCRHSFDAVPTPISNAGADAKISTASNGQVNASDTQGKAAAWSKRNQAPLDAAKARSAAMNEEVSTSDTMGGAVEPVKASIFDLIKPEARAKLQSAINAVNPQSSVQLQIPSAEKTQVPRPPPLPPLPLVPPPPPPPAEEKSAVPARPMLTSSHLLNSTFAGLSQAFKNRFASASTLEGAGAKDSIVVEGMATATEYNKKLAERQEETQRKESAHAAELAKSHPKIVQKGTVRIVTPWAPSPLLCKRFNVKLPDISRPSDPTVSSMGHIQNPITQLLGGTDNSAPPVVGFGKKGTGPDEIAAELERERREHEAVMQDVYQAPVENKPALSVFKSIFEDSDSDDDDEDKDQDGDVKAADRLENEAISLGKPAHSGDSPAALIDNIGAGNITGRRSEIPTTMAVDSAPVQADGPVQFVPSKQRTTVSRNLAGAATSFGAARKPATAHARRSFIQDDDGEEDGDQGTGMAGSSASHVRSKTKQGPNAGLASEVADDEGASDGGMASKLASSGRQISQSVARIGGVSIGGAARKGRAPVEGSLRQRLIAQRMAEEDSAVDGEEGASPGIPQNPRLAEPQRSAALLDSRTEEGRKPAALDQQISAKVSEAAPAHPVTEASAANDAAVEEMLAFAVNILQPSSSSTHSSAPRAHAPQAVRISRFGAPAAHVSAVGSDQLQETLLQHPPLQPPLPLTPPMPQQPPLPPPAQPYYRLEGPPVQTSTSGNRVSASSVRPAGNSGDMRSSIQKLQDFLAPPESSNTERSGREHRDLDRQDKKSHKSHKSSKHKHKKDSKSKHKSHKKKKADKDKSRKESSSSGSGSEDDEGGSSSSSGSES